MAGSTRAAEFNSRPAGGLPPRGPGLLRGYDVGRKGAAGGGGLYSTAADYFRFALMLLDGGEIGGVRLLKASTVEMMRTNVLR
jgi:CubicO group peptidase (beta-lactamase class C family)